MSGNAGIGERGAGEEGGSLGWERILRFLTGDGESWSSSGSCEVWEGERGQTRVDDLGGMTTVGRGQVLGAEERAEEALCVDVPGRDAGSDLGVVGVRLDEERGRAGRENGGRRADEVASHRNFFTTHRLQACLRPVVLEIIQATVFRRQWEQDT